MGNVTTSQHIRFSGSLFFVFWLHAFNSNFIAHLVAAFSPLCSNALVEFAAALGTCKVARAVPERENEFVGMAAIMAIRQNPACYFWASSTRTLWYTDM